MSEFVNDPATVKAAVKPFLDQDLVSWTGLPRITVETLNAAIGKPIGMEQAALGWYPADSYTFRVESPSGGLIAYARNGQVILIEGLIPPPLSAIEGLGDPTTILPHEILLQGTYVHEYIYCEKGLVLSVAEPFQKDQPIKIVRCRGIRPLSSPDEFGPEFYQAFEEKTVW
jgi:hypothetical protein